MAVSLNTKIGLDVSDVVTAAEKYAQSLGVQISALDSLAVKHVEFNRHGKVVRAEIEAQIDAHRRLSIEIDRANKATAQNNRIKQTGGGPDLRIAGGGLTNTAPPTSSPINLQNANNAAAAVTATNKIRADFPVPSNATLTQIARYELAINKVGRALADGKVTGERFKQIFEGITAGKPLADLKLSGDEVKLVAALQTIGKSFNAAKEEGQQFGLGLRNAFRITEALILKDIIGALVRQITNGVQESLKFQIQISQIRTLSASGAAGFNEWSESIRKLSDRLGLPQTDVAEAAYQSLSNQVTKGRLATEEFVRSAGDLARVGVAKVSDSVELLSSAINAYNIDVTRADELNAKFFKAVDLGRFKISDISESFGRVSAPAAALGVSLEEVLAAMATLTNQGVRADDAMTQLNNIFLKLQKPTEAMKALLQGMGAASGQSAVQIKTFIGLMEEIERKANGSTEALAEWGGELRAIRGLTGLATRGKGEDFRTNLAKIQGPDVFNDFERAKEIRAESPGDALIKEFNKVKNFFVDDLGQSVTKALLDINNNVVSFTDAAKGLTNIVIAGAEAWAIYKIATTAATAANAAATLGFVGLTAAVGRFMLAWGPIIAAGAGLAYLRQLQETTTKTSDAIDEIVAKRKGLQKDGTLTSDTEFKKQQLQAQDDYTKKVTAETAKRLQIEALAFQATEKHLNELQRSGRETSDALKLAFKAAGDEIQRGIQLASEALSKAKGEIQRSAKDIVGINQTVKGLINSLRNDFASPIQKFDLRNAEINDLRAEISRLSESNNPEDLQEARNLGKQLLQLVKEDAKERLQFEVDAEKQRRQAIAQQSGGRIVDNSPIRVFTGEQEQRIREVGEFLKNINEKIIEQQKKQVTQQEQIIENEKKRKRELEQAVKNLDDLSPTNKAGDLKPEFKNSDGTFNEKAFASQYDKVVAQLNNLVKTDAERAELSVALENKKKNLIAEQNALINLQFIKNRQIKIAEERDKKIQDFANLGNDRIKLRQSLDEMQKNLSGTIDIIGQFGARANSDNNTKTVGEDADPIRRLGLQIARQIPFGNVSERERIAQENQPEIAKLFELQQKLQEQRDKIFQRDPQGNLVGTKADLEAFGKTITDAAFQLNFVVGKFTGQTDNSNFAVPGGASVGETIKALREQLKSVSEAFAKEKAAQEQQNALRSAIEGLGDKNRAAVDNQINALNPNTVALQSVKTSIDGLTAKLASLPAVAAPAANLPPVAGKYHTGGLIRGPFGHDNLHIMAESEEFIMSRQATRKWLPQLIAMNNGVAAPRIPGQYHEGGIVQTNVGDINITMTGSPSPEKSVREMGAAIKRQIRRGNLTLPYKKA